jgi:hypothetical protein
MIDDFLCNHPATSKKMKKKLNKAGKLIAEVYQIAGTISCKN